jgi:7-cyano-7-deazaguanine synthase
MKVVLLFSGGVDSTVLLWRLVHNEGASNIRCLSVNYGQRHLRELRAAKELSSLAGVTEHRIADLSALAYFLQGSSQTSPHVPVPEGHYESDRMRATVVPNRNMLMLAVATSWAISGDSDAVAYAAQAGDYSIYPDCRPEFASALREAIRLCHVHNVSLLVPFLNQNKAQIVAEGAKLGVPFGLTWTCYQGADIHCGKCGACVERREAFQRAKVDDPTEYGGSLWDSKTNT